MATEKLEFSLQCCADR